MVQSSKAKAGEHVYSPDVAVDNALRLIQSRIDDPHSGIRQNIPGTSGLLTPWRIGELILIVGYTSNGKSSFANYIVTQHAYHLRSYRKEHPEYNHGIVYVTWEQAIEEQTIIDLSRVTAIPAGKIFKGEITPEEMQKIKSIGAEDRKSLPIWLIGHSVMDDRRRTRYGMEEVLESIIFLEEEANMQIDMIVLDYLQRIQRPKGVSDMREGFINVVDTAKDLALRCPVLLLSQAGRQVRTRQNSWQLPDLEDAQETSNAEQSSDAFVSIWKPSQSGITKVSIPTSNGKVSYTVTPDTFVLGFLKQKNGPAPFYRVVRMGFGGTSMEQAEVA